ncbi:MAG: LLM class flavin-dependent oxidoreductase [Pseudomonadota bacterium]
MPDVGIAFDGRRARSPRSARKHAWPRPAAPRPCGSPATCSCATRSRRPRFALAATTRIRVALMAMSPYSTHTVFAAMAAATLDEMFPGRVTLCLGVGAPADPGGCRHRGIPSRSRP